MRPIPVVGRTEEKGEGASQTWASAVTPVPLPSHRPPHGTHPGSSRPSAITDFHIKQAAGETPAGAHRRSRCKRRQLLSGATGHQSPIHKAILPRARPREKHTLLLAANCLLNEALFEVGKKTGNKCPSNGDWLNKL